MEAHYTNHESPILLPQYWPSPINVTLIEWPSLPCYGNRRGHTDWGQCCSLISRASEHSKYRIIYYTLNKRGGRERVWGKHRLKYSMKRASMPKEGKECRCINWEDLSSSGKKVGSDGLERERESSDCSMAWQKEITELPVKDRRLCTASKATASRTSSCVLPVIRMSACMCTAMTVEYLLMYCQ